MTEEDTRPLDLLLPPVESKNSRVDEDVVDDNDHDDKKGFEKVASETTKILTSPVIRGVNATIDAFQKVKATAKATTSIDKSLAAAPADADDCQDVEELDDNNYSNAKEPLLASLAGALERPGRRKYRKMDGDEAVAEESEPTSFQKMAADTAQILTSPIQLTKKAIRKTSDQVKNISKHGSASGKKLDPVNNVPPCEPLPLDENSKVQQTNPPIDAETTKSRPMKYMKKAMDDTASALTKNVQKAKDLVMDTSVGWSHGSPDVTAPTKKSKGSDLPVRSSAGSKEGGPSKRQGKDDDNDTGDDHITIKTVRSGLRKAYFKTKGRLNAVLGRMTVARKPRDAQDDSMRSSLDSSVGGVLEKEGTDTPKESPGVIKIVMTPTIAILLHDVTVALTFLAFLAAVPTWHNWNIIMKNQLPSSVIIVWIITAFFAGMEIGRVKGMRSVSGKAKRHEPTESLGPPPPRLGSAGIASASGSSSSSPTVLPSEIVVPSHVGMIEKESVKVGYALLHMLLAPFSRIQLLFPEDVTKVVAEHVDSAMEADTIFWSTLTHKTRETWETVGYIAVADPLMQRLLKNPDYARKPLKDIIALQDIEVATALDQTGGDICGKISTFDISKYDVSALESNVVAPCLNLRGIDVYVTDDPEDNLSSHPFLLKHGLRSKPTLFINIIAQFANILVYFELPDWFTDFDDIVEADDDTNEVRAIKRFINNDDDYRNNRFKILPCLVDGPLPIRILAPPKKEITIQGSILPTKWIKHTATTTSDGTMLHPCLELEVDLISKSTLRNVSGVLRNYMKSFCIDLAIILSKPTPDDPEEPGACVGLWCADHIDIDRCPRLPDRGRYASKLEADIMRASSVVHLSAQELATIAEEASAE